MRMPCRVGIRGSSLTHMNTQQSRPRRQPVRCNCCRIGPDGLCLQMQPRLGITDSHQHPPPSLPSFGGTPLASRPPSAEARVLPPPLSWSAAGGMLPALTTNLDSQLSTMLSFWAVITCPVFPSDTRPHTLGPYLLLLEGKS